MNGKKIYSVSKGTISCHVYEKENEYTVMQCIKGKPIPSRYWYDVDCKAKAVFIAGIELETIVEDMGDII